MLHRRNVRLALLGAAGSLLFTQPLLAQGGQMNFAEMFLWTEDYIGLAIIWLLIAMSALSIGFALSLFLKHRRPAIVPEDVRQNVEEAIAAKRYREAIEIANNDGSFLGRVISGALAEASNGFSAMERAIEESGDRETTRMLRPLEYLNVVGNVSPMIGLFGTVYGMIRAFSELVISGGDPDPGQLAGGISTALVTTFWGLIVAIPALAFYALIRNKVDYLTSEGIITAEQLIRPFKPGAKKAAPPPSGGGASGGSSGGRTPATPKPEAGA